MSDKNKVNMPMSSAGITRYFDDYKSKIAMKPGHVIFLAIVIIVMLIALNLWGNGIFGQ
ncbi:MAG: preprotein translocase subunit Sec61beta [archaeon]